ncbi:phosphotransferase [Paenibacillus sp. FA6]|uniref:phosphotransferase n=1 Tax=Paenibacillus sp. FA6 TaxID=3413029 RepID=UPI003F656F75
MYFPVTYSTLSDNALTEYLIKKYEITDIIKTTYYLRGMNDTYLVTASEQKYIFRVYRGDWRKNYSEVGFEIDLLQYLSEQGISVSLPIPDAEGELIQVIRAPEGNRFGVLFTFAEGSEKAIDDNEISNIFGRAVADIHLKGDNFQSNYLRPDINLDYLIKQSLLTIESAMQHRKEDFKILENAANQLEKIIEEQHGLDWGICHGDLHGNTNVSFKDDLSMTHYDFDLCGYGWRAYDIAEFRLAREIRLGHDNEKLEEIWNAFMKGYKSIRPLSDNDLRVIPVFVGIRQLWLMGLCLKDPHINGSIDYDDDFIDEKLIYFKNLKVLQEGISNR